MKKTIAILLVAILTVGMVFADATLSGKFTSKLSYDLEENRLYFSEPDNKLNLNFALSTASENEGDVYAVVKGELVLAYEAKGDSAKGTAADVTTPDGLGIYLVNDDSKFEITEAAIYGNGWNLSILKAAEMPKYATGWETYNDGDDSVDLKAPVAYKNDLGVTFAMDGLFQAGFSIDADFDKDAAKNLLAWAATNDLTFGGLTANASVGFRKDAGTGFGYLGLGAGVEFATDTLSASVGSDMSIGIPTKKNVDATFDVDVAASVNYADMVSVAAYYATSTELAGEDAPLDTYQMDITFPTEEASDTKVTVSDLGRAFFTKGIIDDYLSAKVGFDMNAFDIPVALTLVGMDMINNPYFDLEAKATVAGFEITGFGGYQAIMTDEPKADDPTKTETKLSQNVFHVGGEVAYTIDPVGKLSVGTTFASMISNKDVTGSDDAYNFLSLDICLENTTLVSGATLKAGYTSPNLLETKIENVEYVSSDMGEFYVSATLEF